MADKLTGKASYFSFDGTAIKITKATPKMTRELADSTDTGDYDAATDLINPSQLAHTVMVELSVEGVFSKAQTPTALVAKLFTGGDAVAVVLKAEASTIIGHGNFDISEFSVDLVYNDTVKWSATFKSNGKFTPNS